MFQEKKRFQITNFFWSKKFSVRRNSVILRCERSDSTSVSWRCNNTKTWTQVFVLFLQLPLRKKEWKFSNLISCTSNLLRIVAVNVSGVKTELEIWSGIQQCQNKFVSLQSFFFDFQLLTFNCNPDLARNGFLKFKQKLKRTQKKK
jgi:hypothetical protein